MKKWILSVSLAAGVLALSACNDGTSNVVVKSKAGEITQEELYDALKTKFNPQVQSALEELVLTQVLSDKYEVTDKEIDAKLEEAKEQLGEGQYEVFLGQYNLTEESFREYLKLQLLQEKAATSDIEVKDEDLTAFYEDWKPETEIRHILVEDLEKAEEIKKQLDEGKDFAALATENSTDTGSAQQGGSLGWVDYQGRQGFVPEFTAALDELEVGKISEPVQSQFGYHIIEITDMKEKKSFEDMKEEIKAEYMKTQLTPETIQAAMKKELEAADFDIKDKDLKDAFSAILTEPEPAAENEDATEDEHKEE
ncbi:peptidylprolyl isomerase [Bacillus spongiae]|uniref:Foldase protein PrsA n=1 Tax=Bacillus spongiae TaxID=2683610 RepID=A0ABU8HAV4_9BACI